MIKKERVKGFISGVILTSILATTVSVFAAGGRSIEVFDAVKKIVVNKIEVPFDNNNKPFVYNGTTYVPLKFIANALAIPVDWKGDTGTVYVGETDNKEAKFWETDIGHSKWDSGGNSYSYMGYSHGKTHKYATSNMENRYSNYLKIESGSSYGNFAEITFPLNGAYSEFKGILGCTNKFKNGDPEVIFTVLLDGKDVYNKVVPMGMLEKPISINTAGALNITFKVEGNVKSGNKIETAIFNGEFIKK